MFASVEACLWYKPKGNLDRHIGMLLIGKLAMDDAPDQTENIEFDTNDLAQICLHLLLCYTKQVQREVN